MGTATGIVRALNSGIKHLAIKRFTLRYPEEKLKFVGEAPLHIDRLDENEENHEIH